MESRIILEGTLTKVTSSRSQKAELTLGKAEVCWQVRDPEQVGLLTMLQNGVVRVTIEDPQLDFYQKMTASNQRNKEREDPELPLEEAYCDEDVDGAFRPLALPAARSIKKDGDDSDLGEIVSEEELKGKRTK